MPALTTLSVIVATLAVLHLSNPHVGAFYAMWESRFYVDAVDHPLEHPISPYYGYRLLPPLLVRVLPVPHPLGFLIVDYLSLVGAAYWLSVILVHERISPRLALAGAVLFLTFPCSTKWLLTYSAGADAFYLLLLALTYRCLQLRRWARMSMLLLLGIFTKVSSGVLWLAAVLSGTRQSRDMLARIVAIVPALSAFVAVQILWPAPALPSYPASPLAGLTLMTWATILHVTLKVSRTTAMWPGVLPQLVEFPMSFFIVFGMVAVILARHLRQSALFLIRHRPMLVFFLGSEIMSFAGSFDSERCQMYVAIPVLYVFFQVLQTEWAFYGRWRVALPLIAIQLYLSDLFTNATLYRGYMSHYMPPATALKYLAAWTGAACVLAALARLFPAPAATGTPASPAMLTS